MSPTRALGSLGVLPKRSLWHHLLEVRCRAFTLLPQRAARGPSKRVGAKCLMPEEPRRAVQQRFLNMGAAPTSCFWGESRTLAHSAPFGRVPAHALREARPGNAGRCARRPSVNFLSVQLGHPPGGGDEGLRGEAVRRESKGGREYRGGSPLGRGLEREPIGQPWLLPIMRLPPIPPVPFPNYRSH